MQNFKKVIGAAIIILGTLGLAACGGSSIEQGETLLTCNVPNIPNEAGTACVAPPPIVCPAPTVPNETNDACVVGFNENLPDPVFVPAENQAVLYYNRADVDADNSQNDPAYNGWRLHTWNNETCDAYLDADTSWSEGREHTGIDPTYGAYWVLDLKADYGDCHNFIIHFGTEDSGKEMGGGDFMGSLVQDDERFVRMNFTISGEPRVFEFPIDSLGEQPVKIEGAQAHWLDAQTLLWDVDFAIVNQVKLHYSADAAIEITLEDGVTNSTSVDLTEVDLTDEQQAIAPHLSNLPAFAGDWSDDDAKTVLTTQAILGAYDSEGKLVAATKIQAANAIDQLYTTGDNDADEAQLGIIYTDNGITANVWAPTAQDVKLKVYGADKRLSDTFDMTKDSTTGVWTYEGSASLDRQLYRYQVTVFHPASEQIEVLDVTDPYSVSLSVNGRFSQFVNLNDEDLKPDGWDSHVIPTIENFEDMVIYEGHIRDFSIRDQSTSEANRGKYLAFTEQDSVPMQHLRTLAEKGVTHFHVLPANDIATVNEDPARTIEWTSTVQEFCALSPTSGICSDGTDPSQTFDELFSSINVLTNPGRAQEITQQIRGFDQFNWGYDPKHFNTPEGSYSSDADSAARILEMRAMIQSLHEIGLRVALDVVYNHTNASALNGNSVFDKVVPGYYHRYTLDTGDIVRQTCCDDTEPRNRMMEKFMEDSLLMWASQYKYDSFRFDIMSQASKDTMIDLFEKVKAVDPDTYFYGEGWGKDTSAYGDFEIANQQNMAGTEIGTYNDRIRDAIRNGNIFAMEESDAALNDQDRLKMGMAASLTDYVLQTSNGTDTQTSILGGYTLDPADSINYISKHDNETLWDQFNYTLPSDITLAQRVRAQNLAQATVLMSQGIPFLQMGGDFLRSKSMDRNTYDAGDWFNYVDFTMETNNWNVGLPLAQDNEARWEEISQFMSSPSRDASMTDIEFAAEVFQEYLTIRKDSPLFRLTTGDAIKARVGFHNLGDRQQQGLIAMSLDDGITEGAETQLDDLDPQYDAIMVVVNTGYDEKSITVATAAGFELHTTLANSVDTNVRGASFSDATDGENIQGTFTVPALTVAVFVKYQGTERGYGMSAFATIGAPDVVPYGDTTVYVRGEMNGWSENDPMTYLGDGIYQAKIDLVSGQTYGFKIASADWSTVDFGNSDPLVAEGIDKVLGRGQGNLSFTATADATFLFTLDARDSEAPVLNVVNEEPYVGNAIYVKGDMNGWGNVDELEYQGNRIYTKTIMLDAQSYQFKVANSDWSGPNLGASSDAEAEVTVGAEKDLFDNGANMVLNITEAGNYVFVFDVQDLAAPKLRVFPEQFFGNTTVYVRGSLNGWGTASPLVWADGAYSVTIDIDAGATEYKVASEDWSTINLGGDETTGDASVTVGSPFTLLGGINPPNLTMDVAETGTYEFRITGPDGSKPTLMVTKID
ncbi:alpha-1,6-glucosidase domain-containing protein [Glaciecola sp. 1036]|uniref:alpha-1,6-glucosidase domain-containing protein n=1 Tax=Alteromonadaceae TaxID=72275 RepID=UPI003D07D31B